MRTSTFVGLFVAYKAATWLGRSYAEQRAIRQEFRWISFEIGTHADAYALIGGSLSIDDYEQRARERERMLRA